eukprot:366292-Chlamydomonas_euryale.AAC.5
MSARRAPARVCARVPIAGKELLVTDSFKYLGPFLADAKLMSRRMDVRHVRALVAVHQFQAVKRGHGQRLRWALKGHSVVYSVYSVVMVCYSPPHCWREADTATDLGLYANNVALSCWT